MLRCVRTTVAGLAGIVMAAAAAWPAQADVLDDWTFGGDYRLRYEHTRNISPGSIDDSRNRMATRFRLAAGRQFNERIGFGARLTTGNPNDPNSSDVTLGSFLDDLSVSLDRLYVDYNYQDLMVSGGKFANPFRRTDLVWDGDVNPQGVTGNYTVKGDNLSGKAAGIFFIIDEHSNSSTPDSDMRGGQIDLTFKHNDRMKISVAPGYYDYNINSLEGADGGDIRSNTVILDPTTMLPVAYMYDYRLQNLVAVVDMPGFHERYPIKIVGDFVRNEAAPEGLDTGYSVDVFFGRASKVKDARLRYGYSRCEKDAVLAAFSNDNTTIPTDYQQHTVTGDYVVHDATTLQLLFYFHRKDRRGPTDSDVWTTRMRLNAVLKF